MPISHVFGALPISLEPWQEPMLKPETLMLTSASDLLWCTETSFGGTMASDITSVFHSISCPFTASCFAKWASSCFFCSPLARLHSPVCLHSVFNSSSFHLNISTLSVEFCCLFLPLRFPFPVPSSTFARQFLTFLIPFILKGQNTFQSKSIRLLCNSIVFSFQ